MLLQFGLRLFVLCSFARWISDQQNWLISLAFKLICGQNKILPTSVLVRDLESRVLREQLLTVYFLLLNC